MVSNIRLLLDQYRENERMSKKISSTGSMEATQNSSYLHGHHMTHRHLATQWHHVTHRHHVTHYLRPIKITIMVIGDMFCSSQLFWNEQIHGFQKLCIMTEIFSGIKFFTEQVPLWNKWPPWILHCYSSTDFISRWHWAHPGSFWVWTFIIRGGRSLVARRLRPTYSTNNKGWAQSVRALVNGLIVVPWNTKVIL